MRELSFTQDEIKLMNRIEMSNKWDGLTYGLAILLPCSVFVGLGIYYSSITLIAVGTIVFVGFQIRVWVHQMRTVTIFKSLVAKVKHSKNNDDDR